MDTIEELIEQGKVRIGTHYSMYNEGTGWELRLHIDLGLLISYHPEYPDQISFNRDKDKGKWATLFIDLIRRKKRKRAQK